jgi:hypothetical protein
MTRIPGERLPPARVRGPARVTHDSERPGSRVTVPATSTGLPVPVNLNTVTVTVNLNTVTHCPLPVRPPAAPAGHRGMVAGGFGPSESRCSVGLAGTRDTGTVTVTLRVPVSITVAAARWPPPH